MKIYNMLQMAPAFLQICAMYVVLGVLLYLSGHTSGIDCTDTGYISERVLFM